MNNIKTRPQMKRKPFRKNNNRPDNRRSNYSNGSGGGGNNESEYGVSGDVRNLKKAQMNREKYLSLARDALSDGDRIQAENYFQHADHYLRVINSIEPQQTPRPYHQNRNGQEGVASPAEQENIGNMAAGEAENIGNNIVPAPEHETPEMKAVPAFLRTREVRRETGDSSQQDNSSDNFNN